MKKLVVLTLAVLVLGAIQTKAADNERNSCTIVGEGLAGSEWKAHRLVSEDKVIAGANDVQSVVEALKKARQTGECPP